MGAPSGARAPEGAGSLDRAPSASRISSGLDPRALVQALVAAGALHAEDVLAPGVEVVDRSARHRLHVVRVRGSRALVVKQALDLESIRGLQREIDVYELSRVAPPLARHLPRTALCDRARALIALELVEPAQTLYERGSRDGIQPSEAAALGAALADCHGAVAAARLRRMPVSEPWVLRIFDLHADPRLAAPAGLRQFVASIRPHRAVQDALQRARAAWKPQLLMHGDVKLDNCLVRRTSDGPVVVLIDWELAGLGDPAWDLGAAVQEFLAFPDFAAPAPAASSTRPTVMEPLIAAFLRSYFESLGERVDLRFAQRIALAAGARLLQAALEYAERDGVESPFVTTLTERAVAVLTDPGELARTIVQ